MGSGVIPNPPPPPNGAPMVPTLLGVLFVALTAAAFAISELTPPTPNDNEDPQ